MNSCIVLKIFIILFKQNITDSSRRLSNISEDMESTTGRYEIQPEESTINISGDRLEGMFGCRIILLGVFYHNYNI